ncbi:MAG: CCA tRNA nucleotidyltransferase [Clostridia bacterium]|nr:CCA tRNA nucleotidyltransferase [Clostridia bacterium]
MTAFPLPDPVLEVLDRLECSGYEAYLVGGCVRDFLRGVPPHDFDITTSALPEETLTVFSDHRTIETGLRHGTVTVLSHGMPLEITTYRVDGAYTDHRRPDSIRFTPSLSEDLARRDFTVNAMAYSPRRGLADPYGGREDLAARCLRAVGDARRRFSEDALRILRALRFASTLGFSLEEETARAARELSKTVRCVAAERIREELFRLIVGPAAAEVIAAYGDVLSAILPPLSLGPAFSSLPPDPALRLADLWLPLGEAKAKEALLALRTDNATMRSVLSLVRLFGLEITEERAALCRLLRREGKEAVEAALALRAAHGCKDARAREALSCLLNEGRPYLLSHLAVSGKELLAIGIPAGKTLGDALERLYTAVIEETLPNEREALLAAART